MSSIDDVTPQEWDSITLTDCEKKFVKRPDNVNHPSHYNQGKREFIDQLEEILSPEEFMGYLEGSLRKYVHRYKDKNPTNPAEDLRKARWFLDRMISSVLKQK